MPRSVLLDHPIHGSRAVVHFATIVSDARIEGDALSEVHLVHWHRCGHDADVPSLSRATWRAISKIHAPRGELVALSALTS